MTNCEAGRSGQKRLEARLRENYFSVFVYPKFGVRDGVSE